MKPSLLLSSSALLLTFMAGYPTAFAASPSPNMPSARQAQPKMPSSTPSVAPPPAMVKSSSPLIGPSAARLGLTKTAAQKKPLVASHGTTVSPDSPDGKREDKQAVAYQRKSVGKALKAPNFFQELETQPTGQPYYYHPAGLSAPEALKGAGSMFFTGKIGALTAARFVGRQSRTDGDFRYAHDRSAFLGFMRGVKTLDAIPQGKLATSLDVALLRTLNKETHVDQRGPTTKLGQSVAKIWGGGVAPAGEFRKTDRLEIKDASDEEIRQLEADGFRFKHTDAFPRAGRASGTVKLIAPGEVPAALEKLVADTKSELGQGGDPHRIAARFLRRFVGIHPFSDGNGRVGRLVVDRLLAEHGLPPPILGDEMSRELSASEDKLTKHIADGVNRMTAQLSSYEDRTSVQDIMAADHPQWQATTASTKPIYIGAIPFARGEDGFAYDHAGRPYLADANGKLQPMSRMTHYLAVKRMALAPDGPQRLAAFTASTREAFGKIEAMPEAARGEAPDDRGVIKSDNDYRAVMPKTGNQALIRLFDPASIPVDRLLGGRSAYSGDTRSDATWAMSRYQQLDLEMWHIEEGLKASGDKAGAKEMHGYRNALFETSKKYVAGLPKKGTVSADNPEGFQYAYEKSAFERSPLSYKSLDKYTTKYGDDNVWLWHGDAIQSRYVGIHGTNTPLETSARGVAKMRGKKDGTRDFTAELESVEGSSNGTGYQSYTSDLGLLSQKGGFGDGARYSAINLDAMGSAQRRAIEKVVPPGKKLLAHTDKELLPALMGWTGKIPEGHLDVTAYPADQLDNLYMYSSHTDEIRNRIRAALSAPAKGPQGGLAKMLGLKSDERITVDLKGLATPEELKQIQQQVHSESMLLMVSRDANDANKLTVQTRTRTYGVMVAKKNAIPGIQAQGNGGFVNEQEVHVIGKVWPYRIISTSQRGELVRPLGPQPTATATPAQ